MKVAEYPNGLKIEYDENAPCLICDEPVLSASMGGTAICGACDMGKCRYCGMRFFIVKESIDGGKSKKELLRHIEWHKKHTPEIVEKTNRMLRLI